MGEMGRPKGYITVDGIRYAVWTYGMVSQGSTIVVSDKAVEVLSKFQARAMRREQNLLQRSMGLGPVKGARG